MWSGATKEPLHDQEVFMSHATHANAKLADGQLSSLDVTADP